MAENIKVETVTLERLAAANTAVQEFVKDSGMELQAARRIVLPLWGLKAGP